MCAMYTALVCKRCSPTHKMCADTLVLPPSLPANAPPPTVQIEQATIVAATVQPGLQALSRVLRMKLDPPDTKVVKDVLVTIQEAPASSRRRRFLLQDSSSPKKASLFFLFLFFLFPWMTANNDKKHAPKTGLLVQQH